MVGPLAGDLERLIIDLANQAAGIHAVHGDLAILSDRRMTDGKRSAEGDFLALAADLRSTSAFVSGAAQSVEAIIAAASLELAELARAIAEATMVWQDDTELPMRIAQLNRRTQLTATSLERSMGQIEEIISFIDKIALPSSVAALGHVVTAAHGASDSERDQGFCEDLNALAAQAESLTRQVRICACTIISGACQSRAAIAFASTLILEFDDKVCTMAERADASGLALPGIAQRGAAA